MRGTYRGLFALATVCLLSSTVSGQSLTGALFGTVKDEKGGVLPGALVRVTSPALIGGPANVSINERGQWRFPVLPPGTYTVDVELKGFTRYHEEALPIGAGSTFERTVVLKLEGIAESIVVEGSGSRIEARGDGFETRFGPDYLRAVPTRRFSMFDAIRAAPGMSPTSPSSGTVNTVSAFGSGGNENLFLIDGTNFTCPCAGVSRAEPSLDVIQEVQVQSVGVSAEFGNIQGAVFNVVTKQGGDRFQYDASYYGQTSNLTSQPVRLPVSGRPSPTGYERIRYRDATTDLGGPVVRDRLWFFTGYQYLRDYDSQPGADAAFPRTYQQDKIFAKLTWRLTPGLQLMQSVTTNSGSTRIAPTLVTPFEATTRPHASVPAMTFGDLTHTLSTNTVWNVRVGQFVYSRFDDPNSWQALGSYTYSRTEGLLASSGAAAGDPQVSSVAPAFSTTTFGRDPNSLTNAYGRLPNDRPHMFRVMGAIDVPRTGVVVAANLQYFSGKPWAASTQISLPQGDQRILIEPRGTRRLSSQSLLDVRVSRSLRLGDAGRIELLFDVLNALNDTAEEALATDNLFSTNFTRGVVFMDPRRVMLSVRLNLGH